MLDLLASRGLAEIYHSGEITVLNNTPASLEKTSQVFYVDTTEAADNTFSDPDLGLCPGRRWEAARQFCADFAVVAQCHAVAHRFQPLQLCQISSASS